MQALDDCTLAEYVEAGKDKLTAYMFANINSAGQLITQASGDDPLDKQWQRDDMQRSFVQYLDNDWTTTDLTEAVEFNNAFPPIKRALEALRVGDQAVFSREASWRFARNVNTVMHPNGPNIGYSFVQDKEYLPVGRGPGRPGPKQKPTKAFYSVIFNPIDGVIIVQAAYGPAFMEQRTYGSQIEISPQEEPKLSRLSDVIFTQWARFRQGNTITATWAQYFPASIPVPNSDGGIKMWRVQQLQFMGPMKGWLNWVLIQGIIQPMETVRIIQSCIESRGYSGQDVPKWDDRQTFPVGSW